MSTSALSKNKALERIFVYQAVEYGYLSMEQFGDCIKAQEQSEAAAPLLTLCKQKGYLTPSQVNHMMSKRLDASVAKAFGEGLSQKEEQKKEEPKKEVTDFILPDEVHPALEDSAGKMPVVSALPAKEREEYERRVAEKDRLLEREQKQREFLKRRTEELEEKLRNFEQEKQEAIEKIQKEISTLESELLCYKGLHEQREQELNKLLNLAEEKDSIVKREQQKAQGLFNLLEQSGKELRESEEQRLKSEAEAEKKNKELEFLNSKFEKEIKEKNQLKNELEESEKKTLNLTRELDEIKAKHASPEQKKGAKVTENIALETQKKELEQKFREQTRLIARLEEKDKLEATLTSQIDHLKKEQEAVAEKWRQEKRQILEQYAQEKGKMEEDFHQTRISLESDLSQYKQKSENIEAKLQQFQNSLGTMDDVEKKLKKQIEEESAKRREAESAKNKLEKRLKELEDKVSKFQQGELPEELQTGTILPGSNNEYYIIQKKLGRGGMGITYSALKGSDDSLVVVKTLFPEAMTDMKVVMRFVQEARTIMNFQHENLVKGYDIQQGKNLSYFVMEYLDGESVEDMLEDRGFLDVIEATKIILGISKALQYLEEHHLVHRDVKPANIILNSDGVAKLVDFGIVKMTDRTCSLTTEGIILGTPYYLSPEQTYQTNVDIRSDVYCLGATYYHMVVGEVPFPGDNPIDVIQKRLVNTPKPGKVKPDLPKWVCNLIEKMMNKNIKKRHNTAAELVTEAQMVLEKIQES